jgi:hypothetical protein
MFLMFHFKTCGFFHYFHYKWRNWATNYLYSFPRITHNLCSNFIPLLLSIPLDLKYYKTIFIHLIFIFEIMVLLRKYDFCNISTPIIKSYTLCSYIFVLRLFSYNSENQALSSQIGIYFNFFKRSIFEHCPFLSSLRYFFFLSVKTREWHTSCLFCTFYSEFPLLLRK